MLTGSYCPLRWERLDRMFGWCFDKKGWLGCGGLYWYLMFDVWVFISYISFLLLLLCPFVPFSTTVSLTLRCWCLISISLYIEDCAAAWVVILILMNFVNKIPSFTLVFSTVKLFRIWVRNCPMSVSPHESLCYVCVSQVCRMTSVQIRSLIKRGQLFGTVFLLLLSAVSKV